VDARDKRGQTFSEPIALHNDTESAPFLKEALEQRRRFGLRHAAIDLRPMMAGRGGKELHAVVHRSALGIGGAVIKPANARKRDGAGAHRTRLERDVKVAIDEPLGAERGGGCADGDDLGVRRGITIGERAIAGACHHGAVVHDDAADRNLAAATGRPRLL
jgi:hypothetical protein